MDLFDLYQQRRINEASATADAAKDKALALRREVDELRRRADALSITCQALWELLRSATPLTDSDILQKMQEIDLRDGRLMGCGTGERCRNQVAQSIPSGV